MLLLILIKFKDYSGEENTEKCFKEFLVFIIHTSFYGQTLIELVDINRNWIDGSNCQPITTEPIQEYAVSLMQKTSISYHSFYI